MAKTIVGLMDTPMSGSDLIKALVDAGFDRKDIRMLMVDRQKGRYSWKHGDETTGGETGYPADDLKELGVPEQHAHYYLEGVRRGGLLVTVRAADDDAASQAADIMHRKGAIDIDSRASRWREAGWSGYDERAAPYTEAETARERELHAASPATGKREVVLPVVEEEVRVGKRAVETGGVRVYSHMVERPVEKDVTLREERATVERKPVDRPVGAAEGEAFRERTIDVRETSEEPVVSKEARVTEEIRVGKEATERTEKVRGKARKTEIEVDERGRRRPGV